MCWIYKATFQTMNLRPTLFTVLLLSSFLTPTPILAQKLPFSFNAKGLVVLSDADMAASAFVDGKLKTERGVNDALTTISWGKNTTDIRATALVVSNSATSWAKPLDFSKDGKMAFVVENRKALDRGKEKVKNVKTDFPAGNMLYAININDLNKPKTASGISVGNSPMSISIHPNGDMLAVAVTEKDNEIALVDFKKGSLGRVHSFSHKVVEKDVRVTDITWHPSGKFLAVTLEPISKVAFYEVSMVNNVWRVTPFGDPVPAGDSPSAGVFSADGNNYIVTDLKSSSAKAKGEPGDLLVIHFDETAKQHKVMHTVKVGYNPESFALSPDGRFIAVSNVNTSYYPYDNAAFSSLSSLMLFSFDASTGALAQLDEQTWEGVLPKSIAFDNDSKSLVLTSYEDLDLNDKRRGSLHFWEITPENKLQKTGFKLSLTRGAHFVKVVR
ncbi:MAG: hypothetical protein RLZZ292_771 [Bacteroidota bacterium]